MIESLDFFDFFCMKKTSLKSGSVGFYDFRDFTNFTVGDGQIYLDFVHNHKWNP